MSRKMSEPEIANDQFRDGGGCNFDIEIRTSDFELKPDITGACKTDGEPQDDLSPELPNCPEEAPLEQTEEEKMAELEKALKEAAAREAEEMLAKKTEIEYYEGIRSAMPKKYRPEYPDALHMHRLCSTRARGIRRTVDNFKTQPVPKFTPTSSLDNLIASAIGQPQRPMVPGAATQVEAQDKGQSRSWEEHPCPTLTCPRVQPPVISVSDEIIVDYLEDHNVQMLLEYFLGLSIVSTPEEPFRYMADLARQLIKGRSDSAAFDSLPRLIGPKHIESMFRMFDRVGTGLMSLMQYNNAMESIGVVKYNPEPVGFDTNEIDRETFTTEANKAVDELLKSFMFKKNRNSKAC